MSKMEFNKEGLFFLAKKIINQNYSLPKNIISKTSQIQPWPLLYNSYIKEINDPVSKDYIVNESEGNRNQQSKKGIKIKNKLLEKDNIQINEEKMLHLLSERKRKIKQALSHGNKIKNIIGKNKVISINLDNSGNNYNNNINKAQTCTTKDSHKFKKIIKYNTKFENNNTFNENNLLEGKDKNIMDNKLFQKMESENNIENNKLEKKYK